MAICRPTRRPASTALRKCTPAQTRAEVSSSASAAALGDAPLRLHWIDIEDEAELVGDLDIENFPTLLLARGPRVLFFGTVTPHAGTLERLVRGALDGSLHPAGAIPAVAVALAPRLARHVPL